MYDANYELSSFVLSLDNSRRIEYFRKKTVIRYLKNTKNRHA